jgi:3-mercaptopyruvate sulfurtransferase SseA
MSRLGGGQAVVDAAIRSGTATVAVLDGGIVAWSEAGGALTTEVTAWPPAELHLATRGRE